ncbi:MAG: M20/M25/M40 family metallo-hydrolase [Phascolarctobacterium faecium]
MSILLVAHVDTVFNRGEAAKRPFKVDENGFAWGPGVGDDKATVVEVIYGLKALKAGFSDFKEIIYYTNGEEEGGSRLPKRLWQSFLSRQILPLLWTWPVLTGASLHSVRVMQSIRFR